MLEARAYLQKIDTNTGGRNDVTPLFADAAAFGALVSDLAALHHDVRVDRVAGLDALGFILGTALARALGVGMLAVRKGGKLPVAAEHEAFVDYSGEAKSLEVRPDAIDAGDRLLIVDEWIETGAQVSAAVRLIERRGGIIAGITAIHVDRNPATAELERRYRLRAVSPNRPA